MKKFRVYFDPGQRLEVVQILRNYKEIKLNNLDVHSFGITIDNDNPEALHRKLMTFVKQLVKGRPVRDTVENQLQ